MRCPYCKVEVAEGVKDCPRCFAVLVPQPVAQPDESLDLWGDAAGLTKPEILTSARGATDVQPADAQAAIAKARDSRGAARGAPPGRAPPAPTRASPPQGAAPKAPTGPMPPTSRDAGATAAPGGRRFAPQGQELIPTHIVSGDPEAERGTQIVEISLPPMVKQAARRLAEAEEPARASAGGLAVEESQVSRGLDEGIAWLRTLYGRMHRLDRLTLWTLLLALVGCFLPWVQVRGEGLLAGIQDSSGLLGVALSALAVLTLLTRAARRRLAGMLLIAQLLLVAALAGTPIYSFLTTTDVQFSAGPFVTAAAGGTAVLLTLLRLAHPGA